MFKDYCTAKIGIFLQCTKKISNYFVKKYYLPLATYLLPLILNCHECYDSPSISPSTMVMRSA